MAYGLLSFWFFFVKRQEEKVYRQPVASPFYTLDPPRVYLHPRGTALFGTRIFMAPCFPLLLMTIPRPFPAGVFALFCKGAQLGIRNTSGCMCVCVCVSGEGSQHRVCSDRVSANPVPPIGNVIRREMMVGNHLPKVASSFMKCLNLLLLLIPLICPIFHGCLICGFP